MNKYAKAVKDYFQKQSPLYRFDSEILELSVNTMSDTERALLASTIDDPDVETDPVVMFALYKAFNRHNDLYSHATVIDGNDIIISDNTSITELNISPQTFIDCSKNCIYKIKDVEAQYLPVLPLESIADLTNEIVLFQQANPS